MKKETIEKYALYAKNFIFGVEDSLVSTVGLLSGIAIAGVPRGTIFLSITARSKGLLTPCPSTWINFFSPIPIRFITAGQFSKHQSYENTLPTVIITCSLLRSARSSLIPRSTVNFCAAQNAVRRKSFLSMTCRKISPRGKNLVAWVSNTTQRSTLSITYIPN